MEIYFKKEEGLEKMSQSLNLDSGKKNRANPEKQGGRKL